MRTWKLAILFGMALATSGVSAQGYTLTGQVKGLGGGSVKLLRYNEDDRTSAPVDSAVLENGSFRMTGRLDYPETLSIVIQPGNWSFGVFLENGDVAVKADTTGATHYDYTKYGGDSGAILSKPVVSGSQSQADWDAYQADPGLKQYEPALTSLEEALRKEKDIDRQYKIRDQIDSVVTLQNKTREGLVARYIKAHPSSSVGAYMLSQLYVYYHNLPLSDMTTMVNDLTGEALLTPYYTTVKNAADARTALLPGAVAPDFTLRRRDSSLFTLSASRGRYIMIDFWASWCHPCRQAIPHWKTVYNKYHEKGFDIVSVSDDSQKAAWYKALDQEKMPWTQVDDEFPVKNMPARIGTLYMTAYIPFYVLLDQQGKILLYTDKESEIDERLRQIFN